MSTYDNFDEQKQFACRVITDHARATAFSIADGILPGNEGRNYVLRKIMRRAIYQGRHTLGLTDAFFYKVTNFVVDQMGGAYPELEASREFIEKMVRLEEERFGSTMTVGLEKFEQTHALHENLDPRFKSDLAIASEHFRPIQESFSTLSKTAQEALVPVAEAIANVQRMAETIKPALGALISFSRLFNQTIAPGLRTLLQVAEPVRKDIERVLDVVSRVDKECEESIDGCFKELARLYDTFGTPRDLIRVGLEDHGIILTEEEFDKAFDTALRELQQITSTEKSEGKAQSNPVYSDLAGGTRPEFRGYETTRVDDAKIVALLKQGTQGQSLNEGDEGEVVLDRTPFYAESGGQVGDVGKLVRTACGSGRARQAGPPATAGGSDMITVLDTYSPAQGLIVHKVKVEKGTLKVGDTVTAEVDAEKRDATRRNHTATHLMHAALREVLGTHVKQAGSVVAPNYLRFDFSHYQPLTQSEIEEIERLVNYHILRNEPVQTDEMAVEEAMRSGAMALFGEKYGEKVRVLSIKGAEDIFSKELCGGTHVRATGDIGIFKIISDESIASGVRRIRAVTGVDAYERFREDEQLISQVINSLRTSRAELPAMLGKLQDDLKKAKREADELRLKIATGAAGSSASNGDDAREVKGVRVLAREASGLDSAGVRQLSDTLLARIKSGVVVIGRSADGKASLIVRTSDDLTKKVPAGMVIKELAPIIGGKGGGKPDMAEGGGNQPERLAEALAASYGVIERMLAS
jgi:alanyl-tRNA synthetase